MTAEERAAFDASVELANRMNGGGWTPCHWNNLGWHYCVRKGPLMLSPTTIGGQYSCLLGDGNSGEGIWHEYHISDADPNEAVRKVIEHAEGVVAAEFKRLNEIIFAAKVAIGLSVPKSSVPKSSVPKSSVPKASVPKASVPKARQ